MSQPTYNPRAFKAYQAARNRDRIAAVRNASRSIVTPQELATVSLVAAVLVWVLL